MNRFTMAFALAVLAIGSPACAQKSSAPAMTVSKAQATARDSKTEKLAVKSETKEEAEATVRRSGSQANQVFRPRLVNSGAGKEDQVVDQTNGQRLF